MSKRHSILLSVLALLVTACDRPTPYREVGGAMLGTTLSIIADAEASSGELYAAAMELDLSLIHI